jgi:hypothetical protein
MSNGLLDEFVLRRALYVGSAVTVNYPSHGDTLGRW